jgi:hypothetical protein
VNQLPRFAPIANALADQRLGRDIAEEDQRGGGDQRQFGQQDFQPLLDLADARRAILQASAAAIGGGAHLHHIGDVNLLPVDRGILQEAVEQLPRPPDERALGDCLILAGRFADHHEAGVERAFAEDHVGAEAIGGLRFQRLPSRRFLRCCSLAHRRSFR